MKQESQPHILNAASNLLGISIVLIAGLRISGASKTTYLDEITSFTAVLFAISCVLSYASIRTDEQTERLEQIADICFLTGLICLSIAVLAYSFGWLRQG